MTQPKNTHEPQRRYAQPLNATPHPLDAPRGRPDLLAREGDRYAIALTAVARVMLWDTPDTSPTVGEGVAVNDLWEQQTVAICPNAAMAQVVVVALSAMENSRGNLERGNRDARLGEQQDIPQTIPAEQTARHRRANPVTFDSGVGGIDAKGRIVPGVVKGDRK